MLKCMKILLV